MILNNKGMPLAGATIKSKRTNIAVASDEDGRFVITGEMGDVLRVTYIGFKPKDVKVLSGEALIITMEPGETEMEEVIINKGYYTENKRLSVSNVGRVTSKDIEKQPVNNPLLALQGRIPGLLIEQVTGCQAVLLLLESKGRTVLQMATISVCN